MPSSGAEPTEERPAGPAGKLTQEHGPAKSQGVDGGAHGSERFGSASCGHNSLVPSSGSHGTGPVVGFADFIRTPGGEQFGSMCHFFPRRTGVLSLCEGGSGDPSFKRDVFGGSEQSEPSRNGSAIEIHTEMCWLCVCQDFPLHAPFFLLNEAE